MTLSPITRLARITEFTLIAPPARSRPFHRTGPVGPSTIGTPDSASSSVHGGRISPVPHARDPETPAPPSRAPPITHARAGTGHAFSAFRLPPPANAAIVGSTSSNATPRVPSAVPSAWPNQRPCGGGFRLRRPFPAATSSHRLAPRGRRCCSAGPGAAAARPVRSGDGRHSCRAARAGCGRPPVRTVARAQHVIDVAQHRPAPCPVATPHTEGET